MQNYVTVNAYHYNALIHFFISTAMPKKTILLVLLISLLPFGVLFGQSDINQIKIIEAKPGRQVCKLPSTDVNAHFFIQSSPELRNRIKNKVNTAFETDYISSCNGDEWPAEAMNAFEFALLIWTEHINSDVLIKVKANWTNLGENTLGSARSPSVVQLANAGEPDTWYTIAQLSAITGRPIRNQLDDTEYDIEMNVNCSFADWYFGTDANVPENKSDFVTVVLHEIGHGIGFSGSMKGDPDAETAEWGVGNEELEPLIFDRFSADGNFNHLINETVYPNPSADLYDALTGERGGVFFDGPIANNTLVGQEADRAKLYSPNPFNEGSSYSHFDQDTFRKSINALMLPFIDRTFAVHSPGPLFCGTLSDMGWPLGDGCLEFLPSAILTADAEDLNFGVLNINETLERTLVLSNREDADEALTGTLEIGDNAYTIIGDTNFSIDPGMSREIRILYDPDGNERNETTLSISHNAKNEISPLNIPIEGEALDEGQVVELDQSYPNPFVVSDSQVLDSPVVEYAITRNARVILDLYTVSGQHVRRLADDQREANRYSVAVDMTGLSSGIYIYRIVVDGVAKSGKLMFFSE